MKLLKNIFIGLGAIFAIFIVLAIFLTGESSEFKEKNEAFIKEFTRDFSQDWKISSVSEFTTNDFLSQINTPNGKHALNIFSSLGKLVEITDLEITNYTSHTGGIYTAVFTFKAQFENANTLVTATLQEKDNIVRIHGFHINPLSRIQEIKDVKA